VWVEAIRPRTLPASLAPVLVGTAAAGTFIAWRFIAALVVAVSLQVAVNLANDLFDAQRGIDGPDRTGPRRAIASGLVSSTAMKAAIAAALLVAAAAGSALTAVVGPELLIVGLLSIGAALAYSGGPRPYASSGLGEVFVFVFFGLVATTGSAYVQDEALSQLASVAAIPVGMLITAILVVNNLRDIPTDEAAGKRTLAVRLGASRTRRLYQSLVVVALIYTVIVAAVADSFMPLIALIAVPFAVRPVMTVLSDATGRELIEPLSATARLALIHAALLAVGLWTS
jgi:1,4-dihydroxy-2-naphthoate octaprenyltransferase